MSKQAIFQSLHETSAVTILLATSLGLAACGGSDKKENQEPIVQATVVGDVHQELMLVELDASASTDPEGNDLTFSWAQTGGPAALDLAGADTATASFTAPKVEVSETMTFDVTVSDGSKESTGSVSVDIGERDYAVFSTNIDGEQYKERVFVVPADGGEPQQLLDMPGAVYELMPSPDRRHVAFAFDADPADASTCRSLYIAEVGEMAEMVFDCATEFTDEIGNDGIADGRVRDLAWSPDGARLGFIAEQYLPTGEGLRNVMSWTPTSGVSNHTKFVFADDIDRGDGVPDVTVGFSFAWSPDGQELAYTYLFQHDRLTLSRLHVVGVDAGESTEVSDFNQDIIANQPLYADPGRIYRIRTNEDAAADRVDDTSVYGGSIADSDVDADGVADGSVDSFGFMPDGSLWYIADTSTLGTAEMHLVNSDGSEHRRITNISLTDVDGDGRADTDTDGDARANGNVISAKPSPDGAMLAYRAAKETHRTFLGNVLVTREHVHVVGTAGDDLAVIGDSAAQERSSSGFYEWSPDNNVLLFTMVDSFTSSEFRVFDVAADAVRDITTQDGAGTAVFVGWTSTGDPLVMLDDPVTRAELPYILPLDGSGNKAVVTDGSQVDLPYHLSPDGVNFQFALYNEDNDNWDAAFIDVGSEDATTIPVVRSTLDNWGGAFTPDGTRFVGFHYDTGGAAVLDSVHPDGTGLVEQLSTETPVGSIGVTDYQVFGPTFPPVDNSDSN